LHKSTFFFIEYLLDWICIDWDLIKVPDVSLYSLNYNNWGIFEWVSNACLLLHVVTNKWPCHYIIHWNTFISSTSQILFLNMFFVPLLLYSKKYKSSRSWYIKISIQMCSCSNKQVAMLLHHHQYKKNAFDLKTRWNLYGL
jgi:hypothetical protein